MSNRAIDERRAAVRRAGGSISRSRKNAKRGHQPRLIIQICTRMNQNHLCFPDANFGRREGIRKEDHSDLRRYCRRGEMSEFVRGAMPVAAIFDGHEMESATGLSWGDYQRMHTVRHKTPDRKLAAPEWALNDVMLRAVIV